MALQVNPPITRIFKRAALILASACFNALVLLPPSAAATEQLTILPTNIVLHGQAARQLLVVETARNNQFAGEITNNVELSSSDPAIVRIENGFAVPVTNG